MKCEQGRIRLWVESRLGKDAMKPHERAMRFIEEAIELAQASGLSSGEVSAVLEWVYSRDVGQVHREIGGVMTTLLGLAESNGFRVDNCLLDELERIESLPPEKFQKRQEINRQNGIGE